MHLQGSTWGMHHFLISCHKVNGTGHKFFEHMYISAKLFVTSDVE